MKQIIYFHFKPKHNIGDMAVVLATRELLEERLGQVKWSSRSIKELAQGDTHAVSRDIDRHDLVLIGGGGFYSRWALPLNNQLIEAIQKPVVIFGPGFNQHIGEAGLSEAQIESVRILNSKAYLCGVRDESTRDFLHELGFSSDLIGDPALFLRPEPASLVPWYQWSRLKSQPKIKRIGINFACHNWAEQKNHLERLIGVYKDVIAQLSEHYPVELYYLAHTDIKVERQLARRLKLLWPGLVVCEKPARQLRYIYEQMHLVISMMLHSSIYAFGARVPVVNVAYDRKNLAFMKLIGHPERTTDARDANAPLLYDMAVKALNEGFSTADEEKLEALRQATQRFVNKVGDLIQGRDR